MADDRLEKSIDIDLSTLDAKLKQEQKVEQAVEQGAKEVDQKLDRAKLKLREVERGVDRAGAFANSRFRRVSKSVTQNLLGVGIGEMAGLFDSTGLSQEAQQGIGVIANAGADALFGAGIAAAGVAAIAAHALLLRDQITELLGRAKEAQKKLDEIAEKKKDLEDRLKGAAERAENEEADFEYRMQRLDEKMLAEVKEMLYQSSQFQEQ